MTRSSSSRILLIGLLAIIGALTAAYAFWYWSGGETSTVLAALAQPTATPVARPTRTAEDQAARKEAKRLALAEIASGAFGTIERVSGDTVTLREPQGTLQTLTLQRKTQLVVVNKPNATAADLSSGSRAFVLGAKTKTGNQDVIVARVLVVAPATYNENNVVLARLDSVTGTGMQVTNADGTQTVTIAPAAQIWSSNFVAAPLNALQPDTNVLLLGESDGADGFNAQIVLNLPGVRPNTGMTKDERKAAKQAVKRERKAAKQTGRGAGVSQVRQQADKLARGFGQVTAVSPTALELDTVLRGAKTFVLDENTNLAVVGTPNATTADIQVGDTALVRGGKIKPAKFLLAAPSSYTIENVAAGKILAINGQTITLKNKRREVTVTLAADTQIMDRDGNPLAASDLFAKSKLVIIGTRTGSGEIQAQIVFVLGTKQK